jgi:hypothetical protein
MPVPADQTKLAASPGHDVKRDVARRKVVLEFLKEQLFEADAKKDWNVVRRALQCVDYGRPVTIGPMPPAPRRLVALPKGSRLGAGFFAEAPPRGAEGAAWWVIAPEAVYLKYYAASVYADARPAEAEIVRYFIPGARNPQGDRVATKERG